MNTDIESGDAITIISCF